MKSGGEVIAGATYFGATAQPASSVAAEAVIKDKHEMRMGGNREPDQLKSV